MDQWQGLAACHHRETDHELELVVDKLADIYELYDAWLWLWLFVRQRLLSDHVPTELIQQGRANEVLATVNHLLNGMNL